MKRALSRAFDPPAPMVPVQVRAPRGIDSASLEGKLDTGADLCAVPDHLVLDLDLPPLRTVRAAGFLTGVQEVIVYGIGLSLGRIDFPHVEAIVTRRPYVIVGRNVLRRLVLRMDGPKEQLDLVLPRSRKAPTGKS